MIIWGRGEILNVFYRFWSRRSVHKSSHLKTASVRDNGGGGSSGAVGIREKVKDNNLSKLIYIA